MRLKKKKKIILFICSSGAFASTKRFQDIRVPQLIVVSSQPLSQQETLSWKSPALYLQPFLGLLRLSFPPHSLFPAPASSSPLQLPVLFSLTLMMYLRSNPSLRCPYSFHTSLLPHPQAEPLVQSQQPGCSAGSRRGTRCSPGDWRWRGTQALLALASALRCCA